MNGLIEEKKYKTIEVHSTSTCKALQMPPKEWKTFQEILVTLGLKGEIDKHPLATHGIGAVIAVSTAALYLKSKIEQ